MGDGHYHVLPFRGLSAQCPVFYWAYSSTDCDMPGVLLLDECLVGKYSLVVIYYVAGWVLQKMSQAKTIAKNERQMCFDFVEAHSMDAKVVASSGLPTRFVHTRKGKRGAKRYCSRNFFAFICFV